MQRLICLFVMIVSAPVLMALEATEVAVVYNTAFVGSEEVAKAYAKARDIPSERMLGFDCPLSEEITRTDYDEEVKPEIEAFLNKNDQVICLVLCRGMPLKIKETNTKDNKGPFEGRDFAAVDSELSTLRLDAPALTKQYQSPTFNKEEGITRKDGLVMVHRLDGPTQEIALGLIEKAILAESFGTFGQSVLDTGPAKAAYKQRDNLMAKIADTWSEAKLDFFHDAEPAVYDLSLHTQAPLHYNGWYTGSPGKWKGQFQFRTGSIAVHLHSFSASTLRNPSKNWCAPLLSYGATATLGTVYEPYTVGFPYEMIYWDRLCKGFCFADAAAMSNQHISWMAVFIGDPLYTPYRKNREAGFKTRRALVAKMLAAKADKAEEMAEGDALAKAAHGYLRARVEFIASNMKKNTKQALEEFQSLRFLTKDMGLDDALNGGLGDMNKALEKRFKEIKSALKKRVNDTEAYDQAREAWKGLEVMEDVEKYHPTLVKAQVKAAKAWLKKAKSREKSNPYDAWVNANNAALCVYAPEESSEAEALAKKIHEANRKVKKYLKTPNRVCKDVLGKAQRKAKKDVEEAIEMLRIVIRENPECGGRKDCEKELAKLRGETSKKKRK